MDVENTDLVTAGFGARTDPTGSHCPYGRSRSQTFWTGCNKYSRNTILGANEQDYTDTAAYAEQFIQQVVRLRDKGRRN